jgi:hypothetical protein
MAPATIAIKLYFGLPLFWITLYYNIYIYIDMGGRAGGVGGAGTHLTINNLSHKQSVID